MKKTSPLLLLALTRLLLVKGTDYPGVRIVVPYLMYRRITFEQDHVAEYGTHWNFFITLAVIPPLQMSLQPLFRYLPVPLVGLLVAIGKLALLGNQIALTYKLQFTNFSSRLLNSNLGH